MTRSIVAIVFLAVLASVPDHAAAQLVRAYILQDSVTVGDRITLVVVAEHGSEATVSFPTFEAEPGQAGGRLGDLVVFGRRTQGRILLGVGYDFPIADTTTYEVATFALDSAFVPQVTVTVTDRSQQRRASSAPFFFPVVSLVQPDATTMRDITPIAPFQRSILPFLLVCLATIAAALLLRWWWKRPPKPVVVEAPRPVVVPAESPIAEATRRLAALEEAVLSDEPALKAFYVELSETLRTYLERKIRVPALESTTTELYRTLTREPVAERLPNDVAADVRTILIQSDLVKFARHRITEELSRAALGETRVLVMRIEDQYRDPLAHQPQNGETRPADEEKREETGGESGDWQPETEASGNGNVL